MSHSLELILIEDNPHDVEIFLNVVEWIGMNDKVRVFSDGRQALQYLLNKDMNTTRTLSLPAVVFLDLKMPFINGNEVLEILKSEPRTSTMPIVVLTSSTLEDDRIQSYNLGSNSYVVKPLEFEKFAEIIRDIVYYWRNINVLPSQ